MKRILLAILIFAVCAGNAHALIVSVRWSSTTGWSETRRGVHSSGLLTCSQCGKAYGYSLVMHFRGDGPGFGDVELFDGTVSMGIVLTVPGRFVGSECAFEFDPWALYDLHDTCGDCFEPDPDDPDPPVNPPDPPDPSGPACDCGSCCPCTCTCGGWRVDTCDGTPEGCSCHEEPECDCGACCSDKCTCGKKWPGETCGGTDEDCDCHKEECDCDACCSCECTCGKWTGEECDGTPEDCACHQTCYCGACCECKCTCNGWRGHGNTHCLGTAPSECPGNGCQCKTEDCGCYDGLGKHGHSHCKCHDDDDDDDGDDGDDDKKDGECCCCKRWGTADLVKGSISGGGIGSGRLVHEWEWGIPERIPEKIEEIRQRVDERLGFTAYEEMLSVNANKSAGILVLKNPLEPQFHGLGWASWQAELNFDTLSTQAPFPLLRIIVLFMLVNMFIIAVIVTLRQY